MRTCRGKQAADGQRPYHCARLHSIRERNCQLVGQGVVGCRRRTLLVACDGAREHFFDGFGNCHGAGLNEEVQAAEVGGEMASVGALEGYEVD